MAFRFSRHALDRIAERGIPKEWIDTLLRSPGQSVPGYLGREVRQMRIEQDGKPMLLRVVTEGEVVVTALLTSKLEKYGG